MELEEEEEGRGGEGGETKPKVSTRKKIIKIKAEIMKLRIEKQKEKTMKIRVGSLKR